MKPPKDAREIYLGDDGEPIAWCPKDGLGITDLQRGMFYDTQKDRLAQLQTRAREKTLAGEASVALAIDVDDSSWTELVAILMPGHDWEPSRARGERPVARGVVPREPMEHVVREFYPAAGELGPGSPVLVFAAGGILIVRDEVPG